MLTQTLATLETLEARQSETVAQLLAMEQRLQPLTPEELQAPVVMALTQLLEDNFDKVAAVLSFQREASMELEARVTVVEEETILQPQPVEQELRQGLGLRTL